jgi:PadR family transcriptional regulator
MKFRADLMRGVAEPIVLRLLDDRPMYGYEIIKVVNERSDGAFEWKEGTLYPCLHRLEGAGLITSEWQQAPNGKDRKYYALARAGKKLLSENQAEWKAFSTAVDGLIQHGCRA